MKNFGVYFEIDGSTPQFLGDFLTVQLAHNSSGTDIVWYVDKDSKAQYVLCLSGISPHLQHQCLGQG